MLIVFRNVFPPFVPGVVRAFGSSEETDGLDGGGNRDADGDRFAACRACKFATVGMAPVLFRPFDIGKAGRGDVGGPKVGLDGRGNVVAIAAVVYMLVVVC
jgi:hypothetical protein